MRYTPTTLVSASATPTCMPIMIRKQTATLEMRANQTGVHAVDSIWLIAARPARSS